VVVLVGGVAAWLVFLRLRDSAIPQQVEGCATCPPRVDTLDVTRTTLGVMLFVGALLTGLYAYRKQRLAEGDAARADAQQFADRYTNAAEQLGADPAAVRLAGVYAIARLADDWIDQRQTCIDVVCAYLRMPYHPPNHPPAESPLAEPTGADPQRGEDQVRATILRVLADHLRAEGSTSWSTADIDLRGAHLDDADFRGATFSGHVTFQGATFTGEARFESATFSGDAGFGSATFSGLAGFGDVTFSGDARFESATFTGDAWFESATFSGPAGFGSATFSGPANFENATFGGGDWFGGATFSDYAGFGGATFSGPVGFEGATFSGPANFENAEATSTWREQIANQLTAASFEHEPRLGPFGRDAEEDADALGDRGQSARGPKPGPSRHR
jgi:uncharacterized protein YjbI with pentapeptide repeats